MAGKITFNVPEGDKSGKVQIVPKTGTVMWMQIGIKRVKMVLQDDGGHLVHWASGMIAVTGKRIREMQLMVSVQNRVDLPARRAAERIMAMIVNEKGAEVVLEKMNGAEALNK